MSKKILIFGGTGAIGFSIAKKISEENYTPVIISRNEDELIIKSKEINCEYEICDVLDKDQIDQVSKKHGDTVFGIAYCIATFESKAITPKKNCKLKINNTRVMICFCNSINLLINKYKNNEKV